MRGFSACYRSIVASISYKLLSLILNMFTFALFPFILEEPKFRTSKTFSRRFVNDQLCVFGSCDPPSGKND